MDQLAEKLETDWVTVFKKQSLRILSSYSTESIKVEFADSIKKRINGKMTGVKNHFRRDWITDWYGIVDLDNVWFNGIWTNQELFLLKEIEKELAVYGKVRDIPIQIQPTTNLIILCDKMHEEMIGKINNS